MLSKKKSNEKFFYRAWSLLFLIAMLLSILPPQNIVAHAEDGSSKYTSDWELPNDGGNVVFKDTAILQTGITYDNLDKDENGNAVIKASMIYRALTRPLPRQMWIYFRLDPKLEPYLPDYFPIKHNQGFQRYAQRVREGMVSGTTTRYQELTGKPSNGAKPDPYLNTGEPVYRVLLDYKGGVVGNSESNKLEKGVFSGNWGVFPETPVEAYKYFAHFQIPLTKSWDEIKAETSMKEFTLDMRIQGTSKEGVHTIAEESMRSSTLIKDPVELPDSSGGSSAGLWLQSTSYQMVDYEFEGKMIGDDRNYHETLNNTSKTLVRVRQVWPHGGSSYTTILSHKPWTYHLRIDPRLLKAVDPKDKIAVWAKYNINKYEDGATSEPMWISPSQFNDDGTVICTSDESKKDVKGYAWTGNDAVYRFIARAASAPTVSGTVVDIPVKFTKDMLPDDAGYTSYYYEGSMRNAKDRIVKDSYANTYMNLYTVVLDYRGIKSDVEYNADNSESYEQLDLAKFPGKVRQTYRLEEFERDFDGYHYVKAKSGPESATINRQAIPHFIYLFDKNVKMVDPNSEPEDGFVRVTFKANDQAKGKLSLKEDGADAKETIAFDVWKGTKFSEIPEIYPKAEPKHFFDGWLPQLPDKDSVVETAATYTAEFNPGVIGPVEPDVPKPSEDYYTVSYAKGDHGNIEKNHKYFVHKKANVTFGELEAPKVKADEGYEFSGWDKEDSLKIKADVTATAKYNKKIIVPDNPEEPGVVPAGYNRLTFDAKDGKITGTKNQKKVIDVLKGVEWSDPDLVKEIPASATPNDDTKKFDKWSPEVPKTGKVGAQNFDATYKSKDKIIVPDDPENPGDVPSGYNRLVFDAKDGKITGTKNQKKVIDVLKGLEWNDPDLVKEIPASATPNDDTKLFDKWSPEVPKTGKVGAQNFDATYKSKDKIIVPDDPENPGDVPSGYNRLVFDAKDGKITGTKNQKKVIDVLKGVEWNDPDLVKEIPASATPNDDTKLFDKWSPEVPKTGKVGAQNFDATYKSKDKIIVPDDPENPGDVPSGYNRLVFDAKDGKITGTKNQKKVIDVLKGVEWSDPDLVKEIPASATPNDDTKLFDKWSPEVPKDGKVVAKNFDAEYRDIAQSAAPGIDPIKDTDTKITGTGVPGATVTVTIPGKTPVDVVVGGNGTWEIKVDPLPAGTEVSATQKEEGKIPSAPTKQTVTQTEQSAAPGIDPIKDTDTKITGTGVPGATVTVTIPGKTPVDVVVGGNGTWEIKVDPLPAGTEVSATQKEEGKIPSAPTKQTVTQTEQSAAPGIDPIKDTDTKITGTGVPGATVTVTIPGKTPVDVVVGGNGTWEIKVDPLPAGTEVSATQKEEGKIPSAPTKQTVTQTKQSAPGASKPSEHKKDAAPKTGDAGNMMSYGWMLIASGSVLALMKRRRHLK